MSYSLPALCHLFLRKVRRSDVDAVIEAHLEKASG